MKENNNINTTNKQIETIITKGEEIYNSFRNSDIQIYSKGFSGRLSLHDKKCLALYLSIIHSDNFFNKILETLNCQKFLNLPNDDTGNYHFEEEFNVFTQTFNVDNSLELMVLYLLEYPLIKVLNQKEGYPVWKIKLAVYDYIGNRITDGADKSAQKVLTK